MPHPLASVRAVPLAVAAAAGVLLAACASVVDRRVEQAIVDALPRVLGPAERYDVAVRGATRQHAGVLEIERVHAVGRRVQRPRSPLLDRVEAELTDVRLDRADNTLAGLGGADVSIRVLAGDVAAFLGQRPALQDVTVTMQEPDAVVVAARPLVAGLPLPAAARVTLRGRLVPQGAQLRLQVAELRAAGFTLGPLPAQVVERLINPLVDLSTFSVPAEITSARVDGDGLLLKARAGRFEKPS